MKTNLLKILIVPVVLGLLVGGCSVSEPDHPTGLEPQPVFSSYVAIGNSLTAGFMDGGLMQAGQINSYPRLIANQIGFDNTQFTQPWIAAPGIGGLQGADVVGVLRFDGSGVVPLGTTPYANVQSLLLAMAQPLPYSNLGVPGAKLYDIFNAYSAATSADGIPFFDFINRAQLYGNSEGTATVFELDGTTPKQVTYQTTSTGWQAVAQGPTLATVWIGNNDVLGGATSGNPTADNMTAPATFASMYSDMMQLLAGGLVQRTGFPSTIIVANIPNVTDIPYFMTEATFNQVLTALTSGQVTAWPSGYEEGSAQLLTIQILSWAQAHLGDDPIPAIPSDYTLTPTEVATVGQYVGAYNTAIAQIVAGINASGLAHVGLVDMTAVLGGLDPLEKTHFLLLVQQMPIATAANTTLFSLDGVHPNNRGYGVIANEFIAQINATAGTSLPDVDTSALSWDPTYGVPVTTKAGGVPQLSEQAAAAMAAIWR